MIVVASTRSLTFSIVAFVAAGATALFTWILSGVTNRSAQRQRKPLRQRP
jgi:hypothetical protein